MAAMRLRGELGLITLVWKSKKKVNAMSVRQQRQANTKRKILTERIC